ncbi:MAG: protein kinase [Chloroflexi bacterium]|nr:protein kinase [Chloroflexota bacterium]
MEDLIGRVLDNAYRIDQLLGEGGMGAVYKGYDIALNRPVAIKVMHPHIAKQEGFRERFLQEARAIAILDHPGIVQVYNFSRNNDLLYIVMSFITGQNLRDWEQTLTQRGQMMVLNDSLTLAAEVANALDYAHRRGVFHRDIKPGNIILRPLQSGETGKDGLPFQPVVTDFGLAKLAEGGMLSMTGMAMGTPTYMSPEQCEGKTVDGRADIYALGIIVYELVTGRVPFDVKTLTEAIRAHTQEPPPPPRTLNPSLPSQVEEIILKALAKQPAQRFASAGEMETALRSARTAIPEATADVTLAGGKGYVSMATLVGQGVAQAAPSKDQWPTPPSAIPVGGRILVLSPDGQSRSVQIGENKQLIIGRDPEADVVLPDQRVSRRHIQMTFDGAKYTLTDLNSTNGSFLDNNRLLPGIPEPWSPGQSLRIGDHWLRLELPGVGQGAQPKPVVDSFAQGPAQQAGYGATAAGPAGALISASLEPDQLTVRPGESTDCSVRIINQQAQVDHFNIAIEGIPPEWVSKPEGATRLAPGDVGSVTLRIAPPKAPSSLAGVRPFSIKVISQVNPSSPVTLAGQLTLHAFSDLRIGLQPNTYTNKGTGQLTLANMGNDKETITITGSDPAGALLVGAPSGQITVAPGQQQVAALSITSKSRRPFVGNPNVLPFMVSAQNARGEAQTAQGAITIKPYLPAWALPLLMMLILVVCGGVIFTMTQYQKDQAARSTATAVVMANRTAVVVSTAQTNETRTAQVESEAKTGAAMSVSEQKTATAQQVAEAKTATAQAASEEKTAAALSSAEEKTAAAQSAAEAKTATAQIIAEDKTATAKAPTITPTPLPTNTPTDVPEEGVTRPLLPIGKIVNLGILFTIIPSWQDKFADGSTTGWTSYPAGVWHLTAPNVSASSSGDTWFIQSTAVKDFTYVGTISLTSGRMAGLSFRSSADGSFGYEVNLDTVSRTLSISKRVPYQVLATTELNVSYNQDYIVRVEAVGNAITASVDSLEVSVSATDTSFTQGYFGLHVWNGEAKFNTAKVWYR